MMQMLYRSTSLSLYKNLRAYPAGARSVLNITINAYLETVNSTHTPLSTIVCITPSYLLQHKCTAVSINLRLSKIPRTYDVDTSSVLDITCRPNTRLKSMNPIYTYTLADWRSYNSVLFTYINLHYRLRNHLGSITLSIHSPSTFTILVIS